VPKVPLVLFSPDHTDGVVFSHDCPREISFRGIDYRESEKEHEREKQSERGGDSEAVRKHKHISGSRSFPIGCIVLVRKR
jgi:hypothetical protein